MKKKIAIILLCLLLAVVIALLVTDILTKKRLDTETLLRAFLTCGSFVIAILRIVDGDRAASQKRQKLYEKQYAHILRNAFQGEQHAAEYKQLMHCIDLFNRDKFDAAINKLLALQKSCRYTDDYCAVYAFTALSYADAGDTAAAIEYYRKALAQDEDRSTEWSNLGLLLEKQGDRAEAIHCFEQAIRYDANNPLAYNNLAVAQYREGDYDQAIENAKIALEKDSKLYQAATLLCLIYHILDETEESDKYQKIAVANGQNAAELRVAKRNVK